MATRRATRVVAVAAAAVAVVVVAAAAAAAAVVVVQADTECNFACQSSVAVIALNNP
jgi:hypothetical protein